MGAIHVHSWQERWCVVPFVKLKDKGQLTLPAEIRRELELEQGDLLDVEIANGKIVLTKAVVDEEDVVAAVREGLEAYRKGDVTPAFDDIDELVAYLKKS